MAAMPLILITGGSKGIGLAVVKRFLEAKFEVIALARDFKKSALKHKSLRNLVYDLRDLKGIPHLIQSIGSVDVLVNNAGILNSLPCDSYPEDRKRDLLAINLEAPVALMIEAAKSMKKGGRMVNVTSIAGEIGSNDLWYGISKAGLINATKSLAKQWAKRGILVNSVAPGPVTTDMFKQIPAERLAHLKAATYSGKFSAPEDIAEVIFWLGTTAPVQINGCTIDVNEGAFPR